MKFSLKEGTDNTAPDGLSRITDVQGELTAITAYVPTWIKELHNSIEGEHPPRVPYFCSGTNHWPQGNLLPN